MEIELKKFEQLKASGDLPSPKGAALSTVRLAEAVTDVCVDDAGLRSEWLVTLAVSASVWRHALPRWTVAEC